MEDGTSFCPSCGAPQIRVASPEPQRPFPPGTPDDIQPPATPVIPQPVPTTVQVSGAMNWPVAMRAAAIAGLLLGITWVIPFTTYIFWMLACGAFGVVLYRKRNPGVQLTRGAGARIGAVTGVIAFAIFAIITSLEFLATRGSGALRNTLLQVIQQSQSANSDPRAQEMLQKFTTPEGLAILVTLTMIMLFFAFLGLSAAGGAIGASLFGDRNPNSHR